MTREKLLDSAGKIPPPSKNTARNILLLAETLAASLTSRMTGRADLHSLIGEANENEMARNHLNHFNYIASLASVFDPVSLVETVIWVLRSYMARGFSPRYWQVMLPEAISVTEEHMEADAAAEVLPIYRWLADNIEALVALSGETTSAYEQLGNMQGILHDQD